MCFVACVFACVTAGICWVVFNTADVSSIDLLTFLFSVTHLCETMISPSSRSFVSIFLPTDILCTLHRVSRDSQTNTTYQNVVHLCWYVLHHACISCHLTQNQHVRVFTVGLFAMTLSVLFIPMTLLVLGFASKIETHFGHRD